MEQRSVLALSPSFNSYTSNRFAEIAAKVCEEFRDDREELGLEDDDVEDKSTEEPLPEQSSKDRPQDQGKEETNNDTDDDDFEFAFVRDPESSPIPADEIFSNGRIRPIFPIFNRDLLLAGGHDDYIKPANSSSSLRLPLRKLLIEERDPPSSSSSEADELEAVPPGTYCVWTPKPVQASPDRCKKSNSTGTSKRWRFRDFLNRSNSDGKDTFVFLTPSTSTKAKKREEKVERVEKVEKVEKVVISKEKRNSGEAKVPGRTKAKGVSAEAVVSAHEIHYVRNRALKEGDRRRSYLPYRQDLVGFFANVNGLSRNLHPF